MWKDSTNRIYRLFAPEPRRAETKHNASLFYDTHSSKSWFSNTSLLRRCRKCSWMFSTPMIRLEIGFCGKFGWNVCKTPAPKFKMADFYNWLCNHWLKIAASWLVKKARFVWFELASFQKCSRNEQSREINILFECCAKISINVRRYPPMLFHERDNWHVTDVG